ncbi:hypothetical protein [Roseibium polysiphoniae]|uniref:YtkA-like domain-containing protein n=1 Tax=Roseibium polysiphoniae TaxID=2571221 RepID=A0ABR9C736_9HYPH|nr:hypothetical protein [Roseibium polysiphoniae]MBD8874732.1 hypothetical protein [Roseibium polysiphoniae]
MTANIARAICFVAMAALLSVAPALADCGDETGLLIKGDTAVLHATPPPSALEVGEPFALTLEICEAAAGMEVIRLNARMPAHGHGMNYEPELSRLDDGRYLAEGMLLHMPGEWEFVVDVRSSDQSERLTAAVDLKP